MLFGKQSVSDSSPEVAHSLSGGLGVGSCVASQKRKDPQH